MTLAVDDESLLNLNSLLVDRNLSFSFCNNINNPLSEVIITRGKIKMDGDFISNFQNLKLIARFGSGLEFLNKKDCINKGIFYINTPEGYAKYVAEHALFLILCLIKKYNFFYAKLKKGKWDRYGNSPGILFNKNVGIIGFGQVGQALASLLYYLGAKVFYYDPYVFLNTHYAHQIYDLEYLLQISDIISIHTPLTSETRYVINKVFLQKCKSGVLIINTARGLIIKTEDMLDALKNNQVGGYAADVFEFEKNTFAELSKDGKNILKELLSFSNVVLTPHIGSTSIEAKHDTSILIIEKVIKYYSLMKETLFIN